MTSSHRRKPQIRLPKKIHFSPGRFEGANAFERRWHRMNERIRHTRLF